MAKLLLIAIYIAFIGLGLPDALLGAGWPLIHIDLNADEGLAGFIFLTISSGTILSSLVAGKFSQRFGTGKVAAFSVLLTAIGIMATPFLPSVWMFFIVAIPLGLGAGGVDTCLNNYVANNFKTRHMSWLHSLWGVGALLGPAIMSFYLRKNEWRPGYLTVGYILIAITILLFVILPLWKKVDILIKTGERYVEDTTPKVYSLKEGIKVKGAVTSMIAFWFYTSTEALVGLWGSSYLVNAKGLDVSTASIWISCFYLGVMISRLISGFISIKTNNEKQMKFGQIILMLGALLMIMPLPSTLSAVAVVMVGIGSAPMFPIMIQETPKRFPTHSQATMGLQLASSFAGAAIMPLLFGYVATATSFETFPYVIFVFSLIVTICTIKLKTLTKNKQI